MAEPLPQFPLPGIGLPVLNASGQVVAYETPKKPKGRTLSPEQLAKMKAGREKAQRKKEREAKAAAKATAAAPAAAAPAPKRTRKPKPKAAPAAVAPAAKRTRKPKPAAAAPAAAKPRRAGRRRPRPAYASELKVLREAKKAGMSRDELKKLAVSLGVKKKAKAAAKSQRAARKAAGRPSPRAMVLRARRQTAPAAKRPTRHTPTRRAHGVMASVTHAYDQHHMSVDAVVVATSAVVAIKADQAMPGGVPQLLGAKPSAVTAAAAGAAALVLKRYGRKRNARLAGSVALGGLIGALAGAAQTGGLLAKKPPAT